MFLKKYIKKYRITQKLNERQFSDAEVENI